MGIQKNFVVKNGLEVAENLILAQNEKVGINTYEVDYTLDINGSLGISSAFYVPTENPLVKTTIGTLSNTNFEIISGVDTSSILPNDYISGNFIQSNTRIISIGSSSLLIDKGHTNITGAINQTLSILRYKSSGKDGDFLLSRGPNIPPVWTSDISIEVGLAITSINVIGGIASVTQLYVNTGVSTVKDLNVEGNLRVFGTTKLDNTLDVDGATSLNNSLDVDGSTTLNNSLDVDGATTLNSTLDVDGPTTINNVLDVDGSTTLNNSLDVDGATTLNSTLDVDGATTLNRTLDVDGIVTLNSALDVDGNTTLNSTLDVDGATTLNSDLDVSGTSTLGITSISGNTDSLLSIDQQGNGSALKINNYKVAIKEGTFTASPGVSAIIDSYSLSSEEFTTVEYTVNFTNGDNLHAQKVLVLQNSITAYCEEYGVIYNNFPLISVGVTNTGTTYQLYVVPYSGTSGLTTYKFIRGGL
jgi:hypothetical protein